MLALALTHGFTKSIAGTFFVRTPGGLPHHRGLVVTGSDDRADSDPAGVRCPEAGRHLRKCHPLRTAPRRRRLGSPVPPRPTPRHCHRLGTANADSARSTPRTLSVRSRAAGAATRLSRRRADCAACDHSSSSRTSAAWWPSRSPWWAGLGPTALVFGWAAPYAVALVINVVWAKALLRKAGAVDTALVLHGRSADGARHRALRLEFWRYTTPRAFSTVVQTALRRSGRGDGRGHGQTAAQAAVYTATRFVTFGIVGVAALQQALSPLVSKLLAGGERDMAQTVYQTATVGRRRLAWPSDLLSANFAGPLLRVFGAGYDSGHSVVTVARPCSSPPRAAPPTRSC